MSTRLPNVDGPNLAFLSGNTYRFATRELDRGAAPAKLLLNRMLLVLKRNPERESDLNKFIDDQQQKSSPNYHAWLSPERFGQQFGPSDQDIKMITSWLTTQGFQVHGPSKGRTVIEFSGNAGQVMEAFHTEIHKYIVNGEEHWANSSDPAIPSAMASVVAGIVSLHNFPRKPLHRVVGVFSQDGESGRYRFLPSLSPEAPLFSAGECGLEGGECNVVTPYDFATIYNSIPLWNAGTPIDGTGQTIAIVSQSDVYPQDFSNFRADFGLPPATLNIIYDGPPAGKRPSQGDEMETDLDMELAGSVAKGATIDVVVSESTDTTAGADLSALYIVDNNLAPIISDSYGACELDMGTAGNLFYNQLWQQAAAQGITVFVSTGDSGSAVCDRGNEGASQGLSVNGISSTPYNIAVGGTDFDDLQDPLTYWSTTNNPVTHASALSYIPERSWNDTCTNGEFFSFTGDKDPESDCNDSKSAFWPNYLYPVGGSGGASNCITSTDQTVSSCGGGYAKPSWQTGLGVPLDDARYVPDVSLFAADGLNASFYLVCETDIYEGCQGTIYSMVGIGGTSASTPAFAGIMAMVNQKTQSRQGNANYVFYPLAAQPGASCNSSGPPGSSCIFNDVTVGTIAMPCVTGSPNCVSNTPSDQFGVLSGYDTTAGYDPATGLGSVNIANLVNNWDTVSFQPTVSTLSLNPSTNIEHGSPVNLNLTVSPQTGTGTPTGLVSLLTSTGQSAGVYTLANGSVTTTTSLLPGGSYKVKAHYAGDGVFGASDSSPGTPVTVDAEPSATALQAFTLDKNGNEVLFTSGIYGGNYVYLRASVAGQSGKGTPTGNVIVSQTLDGTTTKLPGDPYSLNSEANVLVGLPGTLAVGTYSMSGQYTSDASFKASTSPAIGFNVAQASTSISTYISACPNAPPCLVIPGTEVTILATVLSNSAGFGNLASGTMTFYSNGTPLGPPMPLDSGIIPPVANFSAVLPLGLNQITEHYSGDANYVGSTSSIISADVGAGIAISANPTTIMIASPGQSGSTVLTFTAQNGFTGSASLSPANCSLLPSKSSCSFSSPTLAFTSSTTSVPVTLTITTTAPTTAFLPRASRLHSALASFFLVSIGLVGVGKFRRFGPRLAAFLFLAVIALTSGCGGGSGSGGGTPPPITTPGTPVGSYAGITVSVTINGITGTINNLSANVQ